MPNATVPNILLYEQIKPCHQLFVLEYVTELQSFRLPSVFQSLVRLLPLASILQVSVNPNYSNAGTNVRHAEPSCPSRYRRPPQEERRYRCRESESCASHCAIIDCEPWCPGVQLSWNDAEVPL
jgi:hypothetical protein